ncbi:MAG: hypothetical protein CO108_22925 [Deltaproteobacteria bacterium CG_4_9_14_3_um_filter_63_12]|nr:MAG: hypothetical protein CO108_22925 [Deltaproteobacteria bacterium CG_4_9_14_3_um_filter_63_12]
MSAKKLEWIKTGTMVVGTLIAAGRAFIEYHKFKREQETQEYNRGLQKKAWQQVMDGELTEAKVGDITIKSTPKPSTSKREKSEESEVIEVDKNPV